MPETTTNNLPELSVSELSAALKRTVEERFGYVRVRGEISGLKIAASGHAYLALKDEAAVLDGVMWKGSVSGLRFRPEDGLEVIATGKLTTYPGRSKYQIVIERLEPAGVGALMALLEQRKRTLAAEGLFAAERKRPIPFLPAVIGVITSPTGAVIRDILHRLEDRFPSHVLLWPVLVQGEGAAAQVAAAVHGFNALAPGSAIPRPDLLIVARGGGSIEDLWAFNEDIVVRAVAASAIPVISAVGHETDTTLVDFAADRRAPTPTAAAEMAVPVRSELLNRNAELGVRLNRALAKGMASRGDRLRAAAAGLPHPRTLLGLAIQQLDELSGRLPRALRAGLTVQRGRFERVSARLSPASLKLRVEQGARDVARLSRDATRALDRRQVDAGQWLAQAARLLETLGPNATLARGYAIVQDASGAVIASVGSARAAGDVSIRLADGVVEATVGAGQGPRAGAKATTRAKSGESSGQGTLL
jgi:exodeoxyribonuclease VII large subunit